MKVLDLFCGLEKDGKHGWSAAFKDRGHEVITSDIEQSFNPTVCADILNLEAKDFEKYGHFDVILASPPCNKFSVMQIGRNWKHGQPRNDETRHAIQVVKHTLKLIKELKPRFYIVENPCGMLRKQIFMNPYDRREITQCQYGATYRKPTDLWGVFPRTFQGKTCRVNGLCHEHSKRGSRAGVQRAGMKDFDGKWVSFKESSKYRAIIPYGLSLAVCEACERELGVKP